MSRKPKKYAQSERIGRLLSRLQASVQGIERTQLIEELAVSDRQLRRDVEYLRGQGHDVQSVELAGSPAFKLVGGGSQAIKLGLGERFALRAVRRVFEPLAGTPLHEDVMALFGKVLQGLPAEHRAEVEQYGDRFVYLPSAGPKKYAGNIDALDGLLTGVISRRRVRYVYERASGKAGRKTIKGVLEPYAMVLYREGLYVIAKKVSKAGKAYGKYLTMAAERFTEAQHLRGAAFETPEGFSVDDFFRGASGIWSGDVLVPMVLDVVEEARTYVEERMWHVGQTTEVLEDGRLRLQAAVANTPELRSWILGWGPRVRVVEPPELVEQIGQAAREMAALYAQEEGR